MTIDDYNHMPDKYFADMSYLEAIYMKKHNVSAEDLGFTKQEFTTYFSNMHKKIDAGLGCDEIGHMVFAHHRMIMNLIKLTKKQQEIIDVMEKNLELSKQKLLERKAN